MTDLNSSQSFNNSSAIEALINQNAVNNTNVLQKLQNTSDAENQQIKSTITNADVDTTELVPSKHRHTKKSAGTDGIIDMPLLPLVSSSSNPMSGLTAYLELLQMLNLIPQMQSNTSEKESIASSSFAIQGAIAGGEAAQANYTSDMNNADASKASGWASIVGGIVSIVAMGAGTLLEPAEAAENIESGAINTAPDDSDLPVYGPENAPNGGAGDDPLNGEPDEDLPEVPEGADALAANNPNIQENIGEDGNAIEAEADDNAEEIAKLERNAGKPGAAPANGANAGDAPAANGGADDAADPANTNKPKVADSNTKENTPSKWRVNGAKFLTTTAPQAFSGAATGVGQKISGSLSAAAALPKEQAAYAQVLQGLTTSVTQSAQSLIGNSDKEIGTVLDLKQQTKQMNAQIAQAFSR